MFNKKNYFKSLALLLGQTPYIETLLTYGNDAAESHLKNGYWYLNAGNMKGRDYTKPTETTNGGSVTRCNKMKESQTIEMYGRIHSDICNVPLYLLPGVKIQIKLTKPGQLSTY